MGEAWPPDYVSEFQKRQERLRNIRAKNLFEITKKYYSDRPVEFIEHWCVTYDPRNAGKGIPTIMPFVMFQRQRELVLFLLDLIQNDQDGLIEKCRDMGATWVSAAFSVWLWLFKDGAAVGWGSRKELLVDRIGDPDSIFEKKRYLILTYPP